MPRVTLDRSDNERRSPRLATVVLGLGAALLCACRSAATEGAAPTADWLEAAPILEQQIAEEAQRLPWTHGLEHLQQIRWFASIGEAAYPTLLELARDERDHVAAAALAALGATRDRRLVEHVRGIQWSAERSKNADMAFERARTLVRLGDWSEIPILIQGLGDERVHARALCDQALFEATHQRFGYDPRGSEKERGQSIRRWQDWWVARGAEALLGPAEQRADAPARAGARG